MSKDDEQELKKVVTKGHWNLAKDKAAIQVTDSGSTVCPLSARHASCIDQCLRSDTDLDGLGATPACAQPR